MLLTGAEIIVKSLLDEGVDTIFGYPGGSVLNIYDYLYKYKDKIKHYNKRSSNRTCITRSS